MVIILLLGVIYERYSGLPGVRPMFAGLAAAASGLVLSTALKIAAPLRHNLRDVLLAVASWAAIVLLHVPLVLAMLVLAPLGILLAARSHR
jgi:chromate transporter